ncbi:MAG TPA: polyphosphate kinase 2 family protein [Gemmatimonadota bacterium]|nr:polyphosphate kinase 2 family protein [Gemmatimonadota bacterium]
MIDPVESPHLVPFDGSFRVADAPTGPPADFDGKKQSKARLKELVGELDDLQRVLYATDRDAILLVFQAMDAAGKDGTIRAVLRGVNPAGCQVFSFKQPSPLDLDHDFLWRTARLLPERGLIGIFNRSYYEEVLIVRVHPEYLAGQKLPDRVTGDGFWKDRYASIRDHERHLARNGTVILKFWLNVSKEEQKARFLSRIDEPEKNWKFSLSDIKERKHWDRYMEAYEEALNETSRTWAPWYAIPADSKAYMRESVARILVDTLRKLDLRYPEVDGETRDRLGEMKARLEEE